ncbi:YggT family protein [Cumulibacter manganitolerans]|uniref:YggT family protein n=1 Tax=Cumulibacter manganitolerans TaxID=1884992 RepID=UPI001E462217|nr:YggT family protein [Cumulibacter manganitolerans]
MNIFLDLLHLLLFLAVVLLWIRMVLEWVRMYARRWVPSGVPAVAIDSVYTITDPPVKLMRRLIPPIAIGGARVDVGFMVLLLILSLLLRFT